MTGTGSEYIPGFEDVGRGDVALVGGKNASLGEMKLRDVAGTIRSELLVEQVLRS